MSNTIVWRAGDHYYVSGSGGGTWEILQMTDREFTICSCTTGLQIQKSRIEHDQNVRDGMAIPIRGLSGEIYRCCKVAPGYGFSYEIQRRTGDQMVVKFFACGPNSGWKNDDIRDLLWSVELDSIKRGALQPLEVNKTLVNDTHDGPIEPCKCNWDQLYYDGTHSNPNCRDRV